MKTFAAAGVCVSLAILPFGSSTQKSPSTDDLLRAAREYLSTYTTRVSGLTLEEEYSMMDVSSGRMTVPVRLTSDLVLLNLAGTLIALRDPFAIDTQPLRPHEPRIVNLLQKPSQAAWEQAQAWVNESMRRFPADLVVKANDPVMPLQVLKAEHEARLTFTITGRKKISGIDTVGLRFKENKREDQAYIFETAGHAAAFGRLWVDPASGAVLRTEFTLQSEPETAHVEVEYTRDRDLDLWLPARMVDDYSIGQNQGAVSMGGVYVMRQKFECRASYSNPRLTPIDLTIRK